MPKKSKRPLIVSLVCFLVLCPLTAVLGALFLKSRSYYLIAVVMIFEAIVPFFFYFEHRKIKTSELVTVAVMISLCVVSRIFFVFLPQVKPMCAFVVVTGCVFGANVGFVTGALSVFISTFAFGQGMFTPFQMLAMGLCGFFAGLIFSRRRSAVALCIYGFFSVVVLYGGIMNISSVLIYQSNVTVGHILSYIASGLPFDLIHGTATVVFLLLGGTQILEKCERAKVKFGLFQ